MICPNVRFSGIAQRISKISGWTPGTRDRRIMMSYDNQKMTCTHHMDNMQEIPHSGAGSDCVTRMCLNISACQKWWKRRAKCIPQEVQKSIRKWTLNWCADTYKPGLILKIIYITKLTLNQYTSSTLTQKKIKWVHAMYLCIIWLSMERTLNERRITKICNIHTHTI